MLPTFFTPQQEPQLQHLIPQNWTQVKNNQQSIQLQFTSNSQNALYATKTNCHLLHGEQICRRPKEN